MGWRPGRDARDEGALILVETSAWVEFLRGTGSAEAICLRNLVESDAVIAVCDPVRMELLAGARTPSQRRALAGMLDTTRTLPMTPGDYDTAALLYSGCRAQGVTVRRLLDCLIAAVAIRTGTPVLHRDRDFAALAAVTPLVCHVP